MKKPRNPLPTMNNAVFASDLFPQEIKPIAMVSCKVPLSTPSEGGEPGARVCFPLSAPATSRCGHKPREAPGWSPTQVTRATGRGVSSACFSLNLLLRHFPVDLQGLVHHLSLLCCPHLNQQPRLPHHPHCGDSRLDTWAPAGQLASRLLQALPGAAPELPPAGVLAPRPASWPELWPLMLLSIELHLFP